MFCPSQIPTILDWGPAREFLSIEDQRSVIPIYDNETIDEQAEAQVSEFDTRVARGGKGYPLLSNEGTFPI